MGKDSSNPKYWKLDDCIEFLKTQDMLMYKNIFEEHEIDGECLMNMKEADLEKMGITAKGHRIRLREEIGRAHV